MRGRVNFEERANDREAIIVTEVPFQVNKAAMMEKMAELVREKRIEGISDIRDESDRQGYRVVIELKRDANADVILNQLYRYTPLQTSFGANMVALNGGKPELLTLTDMLKAFVAFREEVVSRRTKYLLRKARDRAHVLVGLAIAVANIDEVIRLIRRAADPQAAREQLMERRWPAGDVESLILLIDDPRHKINEDGTYNLSEEQARAILALQLSRLTALGRDEIADELNKIGVEITDFLDILRSRARIQKIVKDELLAVRDEFGTPRRTEITDGASDMDDEDLIPREEMVVTVTHDGYIKRLPLSTYRAQGAAAKALPEWRPRRRILSPACLSPARTRTGAVFLVARHSLQGKGLAHANRHAQSRGKFLRNLLRLEEGDRITRSCRCRKIHDSGTMPTSCLRPWRHDSAQQVVRLRAAHDVGETRDGVRQRGTIDHRCSAPAEDLGRLTHDQFWTVHTLPCGGHTRFRWKRHDRGLNGKSRNSAGRWGSLHFDGDPGAHGG